MSPEQNADLHVGGLWSQGCHRHRQLGISRLTESAMGLSDASDTRDYAAIATPATLAQVAKAWVRSQYPHWPLRPPIQAHMLVRSALPLQHHRREGHAPTPTITPAYRQV